MLVGRQRWLLVGLLAGWLAAPPLAAQEPPSRAVAGTVRDPQGRPLAGATVAFRGLDASLDQATQTDNEGRFSQGGLPPGRYRVSVSKNEQVLWSLPITLGVSRETLHLDIDLKQPVAAAESGESLDPALVQLRQAELERRLREERLQGHFSRAATRLREGRPEEALGEYQAALALDPERGLTHALLAAAAAAAQRRAEAIEHYRRALELDPGEAAHYNNLGVLFAQSGELDEAISHFDKAAQLEPLPGRAASYQFNRGAALLNAGCPTDALPALRQAVRGAPTLAVAHYFLGVALFLTSPRRSVEPGGERVEPQAGTLEAFQRYLQLAPDGEYAVRAGNYLKQFGVVPRSRLGPEAVRAGAFP